MPETSNGRPVEGDQPGTIIAAEMLRNLILLNENIKKSHEIYERLADAIADLSDYHETYMRATEIMVEKADEGKVKFSVRDFAQALLEAADEVMGESEDEPGEEDPLIGTGRR